MKIDRDFQGLLEKRLREKLNNIQVLIGPRQVGKTTGVKRVLEGYSGPKHFASADSPAPHNAEWLSAQWNIARRLGDNAVLVIDEIQKVTNWAEATKALFDEHREEKTLKVVFLGSASLSIQTGLISALAGRFELIKVPHWSFEECQRAFGWHLDTFLNYGGYPAAAEFVNDFFRWQSFVRDSIVEPVIGRDISGLVRINNPSLFRQAFRLAMNYPAQVVSYQKFLGQLQERGNASTVKHYLELFESAFLIKRLEKFSGSQRISISSSPKIVPLAPALINSFASEKSQLDQPEWRGRTFESYVISQLLKLSGEFFYWADNKHEVDLVRRIGQRVIAYEIKSGTSQRIKSLHAFRKKFPDAESEIITFESDLTQFT
jgi:predicted AAA+ superfamily ATPase